MNGANTLFSTLAVDMCVLPAQKSFLKIILLKLDHKMHVFGVVFLT